MAIEYSASNAFDCRLSDVNMRPLDTSYETSLVKYIKSDGRSIHGVADKSHALYLEVPSLIASSFSLSDETLKLWSHLHMTVGGTSNINSLKSDRIL